MSEFSREVIITVTKKNGNEVLQIEMNPSEITVEQLKNRVMKKLNITDIGRVSLSLPTGTLNAKDKTLYQCGVKDDVTINYRDMGPQVPWRMVYIAEYWGPVVLLPIIYMTIGKPTQLQKTAFFLAMVHYVKRIIESAFLHTFSKDSMPIKNLAINGVYYWILFGLGVGLSLKGQDREPYSFTIFILSAAFLAFEFLNYQCHQTLANLRKPTQKDREDIKAGKITEESLRTRRGIPRGWGFDLVSCANYFWEVCIWFTFALLVRTTFAWIFAFATLAILSWWATARHKRYKKEFDGQDGREQYPKNRKALIPNLL